MMSEARSARIQNSRYSARSGHSSPVRAADDSLAAYPSLSGPWRAAKLWADMTISFAPSTQSPITILLS